MVKKIVIEFEAGNDSKVADRVFESAIKYIRKSGGRIVGMRTEDVEPEIRAERRKDFSIPDLSKSKAYEERFEFETGSKGRSADRVFESIMKHKCREEGKVLNAK